MASRKRLSFNLDLWALGVTIYELITGKDPFKNSEQDSSEQIMTNIMAPGVPDKIAELPQPFYDIVYRCLVKDARERAQKADELIVLLNRTLPENPARSRGYCGSCGFGGTCGGHGGSRGGHRCRSGGYGGRSHGTFGGKPAG